MMVKKETALTRTDLAAIVPTREIMKAQREAIKENFGDEGIRLSNFPRIPWPSGGAVSFEVPTLDGVEPTQELIGFIPFWHRVNVFYADRDSTGSYPDCIAYDGKTGGGNPGGACKPCPRAVFVKGKGRDCRPRVELFFKQQGVNYPNRISVPTTSIKPLEKLLYQLALESVGYQRVIIGISLKKETNANNDAYSVAQFRVVQVLDKEFGDLATEMRASIEAQYRRELSDGSIAASDAQASPETTDTTVDEPLDTSDPM